MMIGQMDRDEHLKQLVDLLEGVFIFLTEAVQLEAIETLGSDSQLQILTLILKQTTECGYFICAYAKDTGYCEICLSDSFIQILSICWSGKRLLKNMVSEADTKIQDFRDSFTRLQFDFLANSAVETQLTVLRFRISTEEQFKTIGLWYSIACCITTFHKDYRD
jgi:hypothetical protein